MQFSEPRSSLQSCCRASAGFRQCHTKYAKDPHVLSSTDASLEVRNVHVSMSNGILSNLLLKHNLMTLTPDNYLIGQICLLFAKFNDFFWFHVLLCGFYMKYAHTSFFLGIEIETLNSWNPVSIQLSKMMFDTLVCPLSSDQEEEDCKNSFEIFKGSTKSLCEEVLQTKT